MDPRLRMILLTLLQLAVEQETRQMTVDQLPEKDPLPAPGSLEYFRRQLEPPQSVRFQPSFTQTTDFGNA